MVQVVEVQRVGADRIRVTYEDSGQRFWSDVHRDSGVDLFSPEAFDYLEQQFRERVHKGVVFGVGKASDGGPGAENIPIHSAIRYRYWALRWGLAEIIAGQSLDQDEDW